MHNALLFVLFWAQKEGKQDPCTGIFFISGSALMSENRHEWCLVDGSTSLDAPAIVNPVLALGDKVPMEVFVKRFISST
jgi:hypothetical protein